MKVSLLWQLALLVFAPAAANAQTFNQRVLDTLAFIEQRLLTTVAEVADPDAYPKATDPGTGDWLTVPGSNWASGYFPGQLWLSYGHSGNPALLTAAQDWTAGLAPEALRTDLTTLVIMHSFGQGWRITGDAGYAQTLLTAARSLDTRYDADVGAHRSWDWGSWQFPVIIDGIKASELLLWGAEHTTDPIEAQQWLDHSVSHADVTLANHYRPDGSTYHVTDYDPASGALLSQETYQGYGDETTWARGQSWAVYGFSMMYRETGDSAYLDAAKDAADYYLANLPPDRVPYWDFQAPGIPNEPRDSSAAAATASGLIELASFLSDPVERVHYRSEAVAILDSLMSGTYLSDGIASDGILLHGTGNKPGGMEIDVSLIYGDYYFTEALIRYLETTPTAVPALPPAALVCTALLLLASGFAATRRQRGKASGPG